MEKSRLSILPPVTVGRSTNSYCHSRRLQFVTYPRSGARPDFRPVLPRSNGSKCEILVPNRCLPLCLQIRTQLDAVGTLCLCEKRPLGADVSGEPSIR